MERMHYEPDEVVRSGEGQGSSFWQVMERRLSRRGLMKAGVTATVAAAVPGLLRSNPPVVDTGLGFTPIGDAPGTEVVVPEGYTVQPFHRWGDPLFAEAPEFDPDGLSAEAQAVQVGYNCDFVGYFPIEYGTDRSDHGLLVVNHEYVNPEIMFASGKPGDFTRAQIDTLLEAVGVSVAEVKLADSQWSIVKGSKNARYSLTTPFELTGPARGHDWMKTSTSEDGTTSIGTCSNCSAGKTPWGTVLSAEENFQDMFANAASETDPAKAKSHGRYGISTAKSQYGLEQHHDRFDVAKEPNECFHFGWVVEVDPYDPEWTPKKRTALGRFRHEAATTYVAKDGRVVMYSGCDSQFEYVYKFVSAKAFDPTDRIANRDLMDEGTLYVARYNEDGTGEWLPLVQGTGPLTAENGFATQGDVVIDARSAADLLGATKMDRPEDIEVNPANEKVYVVCTNNTSRAKADNPGTDTMNPRPENRHGHIIEVTEAGDDHTATTFSWEMFLVCGDPADESTYFAGYDKTQVSPVSCPDNVCFDRAGNIWIATDGQERSMKRVDGVYVAPVEGPERGKLRPFLAGIVGGECAGPEFTPDETTFFVAIQHPGEGSSVEKPSTRWPDGKGLPRPTVVAIRRKDGGPVGGRPSPDRREFLTGLLGR